MNIIWGTHSLKTEPQRQKPRTRNTKRREGPECQGDAFWRRAGQQEKGDQLDLIKLENVSMGGNHCCFPGCSYGQQVTDILWTVSHIARSMHQIAHVTWAMSQSVIMHVTSLQVGWRRAERPWLLQHPWKWEPLPLSFSAQRIPPLQMHSPHSTGQSGLNVVSNMELHKESWLLWRNFFTSGSPTMPCFSWFTNLWLGTLQGATSQTTELLALLVH